MDINFFFAILSGQIKLMAVFRGAIPEKCTKLEHFFGLCLLGSNGTQITLVHLLLRISPQKRALSPLKEENDFPKPGNNM